jgi:hypothetical protein
MKYSLKFFDDTVTQECKLLAVTKALANTDVEEQSGHEVEEQSSRSTKAADRKLLM